MDIADFTMDIADFTMDIADFTMDIHSQLIKIIDLFCTPNKTKGYNKDNIYKPILTNHLERREKTLRWL